MTRLTENKIEEFAINLLERLGTNTFMHPPLLMMVKIQSVPVMKRFCSLTG